MDKTLDSVLNCIDEGIVILDRNLNVLHWNNFMQCITNKNFKDVFNCNIYSVIPSLNKSYFNKLIDDVLYNGNKMFFSHAIHKNIFSNMRRVNLRVSKINESDIGAVVMEFIDVTDQFNRIHQFKDYIKKLYILNEKLKEKEKIINDLAYYDTLTGVSNRNLFYKIAEESIKSAERSNLMIGLMFVDLDKFKFINDTYGHKMGDEVLKSVVKLLKDSTRKSDMVARYGGDEFLILFPNLKKVENIDAIARRIIDNSVKILVDNSISVSISIGISVYPIDGTNIDEIITRADKAMYCVKKNGGSGFLHYKDI